MKTTIRMAVMMSLAVVLALIAFVSPISAVSVGTHDITYVNHTYNATSDTSTWTYIVTSGSDPSLGHWIIAWCNEDAIINVSEPGKYGTDPDTGITGIKFDKGYKDNMTRIVWFELKGNWHESSVSVKVGTNAKHDLDTGYVTGPTCNGDHIPEFATIAIPIVALLGLFVFYHRKQKK